MKNGWTQRQTIGAQLMKKTIYLIVMRVYWCSPKGRAGMLSLSEIGGGLLSLIDNIAKI